MSTGRACVGVAFAAAIVAACGGGDELAHFGFEADASDAGGAGGRASTSLGGGGSGGARPGVGAPNSGGAVIEPGVAPPADASALDAASDAGVSADASSHVADAAPDADAAPGACTVRSVWYADGDHDGFGDRARVVIACEEPANGDWVANADDCDDADARVHPGQTAYFGAPYTTPGGDDSFDYDCSGNEDVDPSLALTPGDCALLAIGSCGGSGYLPTDRAGAGKSPFCGSVQTLTCSVNTLVLCVPTKAVDAKAFGCK